MQTEDGRRAARDRAATEHALIGAALRLLERDGVLAGLNLREAAAEAGVNRGLIYHYFGSRRDLLRAALATAVERGTGPVDDVRAMPFAERRRRVFEVLARSPAYARLLALLVLDGDEDVRPFPHLEQTRDHLARDLVEGHLPQDADAVALHVITSAAILGYSLFREAFARNLDVSGAELDRRAGDALAALLDNATRSEAAAPGDA